jgi:hypothetical protein
MESQTGGKEDIMIEHSENKKEYSSSQQDDLGFAGDAADMPRGYFYSAYFLGSMAAVGMSLLGSVGGYALAAPILGTINADIGPNKNIAWVPLMFPVGLAIGQTLLGRLSDIFGTFARLL